MRGACTSARVRTKVIRVSARLRAYVTRLMRSYLADALVVTIVHEYRHLAQAARVRAMPEFPN